MDAIDRASLAGLSPHEVAPTPGASGLLGTDPGTPLRAPRRIVRRPAQPAADRGRHPNRLDAPRVHPCGAHAPWARPGVGSPASGCSPGGRERL